MCGIAGYFEPGTAQASIDVLTRMADGIVHRGPDDMGVWVDPRGGMGLAHRRLSIIDLSEAGHQPMTSASGRHVIVFNGEIYNHLALRAELVDEGLAPDWRGHSDTETLLAAIEAWGLEMALQRVTGMFAFAVWDREMRTLSLARDRLGEKPLYYGWQGQGGQAVFLFGSELKAIRPHPAFEGEVDRGAISLLLRHNCVPAPYSIYRGIAKLPAGHFLVLDEAALQGRSQPEPVCYWSLARVAEAGVARPWQGDDAEAVAELDGLLRAAIGRQMMADVPLGAFLSGGIDSSTVVALMQAQSSQPVRTFSIGFHEAGYDEAVHAKAVARHLGTDHTELYVSAHEAMAVIPRLPQLYDEPFADSSQIPTFLVSQLARRHVAVSLSGDGGDELFCGYNRYQMTARMWHRLALLPQPLRRLLAGTIQALPPERWDALGKWLPGASGYAHVGEKLHKGATVMGAHSADELYLGFVSHWANPAAVVVGGAEPPTLVTANRPALVGLDAVQQMMALDALTYMADDILVKVDRAAMGVSLEGRVPFLDHSVVEFAWSLPQSLKLRQGQGKWILRQVLYRYVPRTLIERPKMGFGMPLGAWLRGPLREWAESLLDEGRLRREGFFRPEPIRRAWQQHLAGRGDQATRLWDVLMFQAWLEHGHGAAGGSSEQAGPVSLRMAA
ncbi:MAG: asparagine synthase (glutamine-hydrolyzing) [Lautropia sp.]|nr:asparagine synthase (glutamine-hydrolyzing) [Lautropia sp.]